MNKIFSVPSYRLFVPLQGPQMDKLSPEAIKLAQTLYNQLPFSFLTPNWLSPCNTNITFHKYFWCSQFCVFHNKTFIISLTNFCKLVKIKEPQQFCEICNVSFNEDQQENHRDCQPDVCLTSLEVSLNHFFCISYVSFLELFKREFSAPTGHFFSLSA